MWKIIQTDNLGGDYYPADQLIADNVPQYEYARVMAEALNQRRPSGETYFKAVLQDQPLKPASVFIP